jgi:hypothetical protein
VCRVVSRDVELLVNVLGADYSRRRRGRNAFGTPVPMIVVPPGYGKLLWTDVGESLESRATLASNLQAPLRL